MVTIDVGSELAQRLSFVARLERISEEELLARIIEGYPKRAGQRSLTAGVTEAAATVACVSRGSAQIVYSLPDRSWEWSGLSWMLA